MLHHWLKKLTNLQRQPIRTRGRERGNRQGALVCLEILEDRNLLSGTVYLPSLQGAADAVRDLGGSLAARQLNQDLPVLSGGTQTLDNITGVSATFATIRRALVQFDPRTVTTGNGLRDQLNAQLGPQEGSFQVQEFDDTQILVTYNKDLSGSTVALQSTTDVGDFGGGHLSYFSDIRSMTGSGTGTLAQGSTLTVTFGADKGGFFVNPGTLFSGNFSGSLPLTGVVHVGQMLFQGNLSATATIELDGMQLALNQRLSGSDLANGGDQASFSLDTARSHAGLVGDLQAQVLGVSLLEWNPTIDWQFTSTGSVGNPQVDVGTPGFISGAEAALQCGLGNVLRGALGVQHFGVGLDPLTNLVGDTAPFQQLIEAVTSVTNRGIQSNNLNPESVLDGALDGGSLEFNTNLDQLKDIAQGMPGINLVTFSHSGDPVKVEFPIQLGATEIPLAGGIVILEPSLNVTFGFNTHYDIGLGIDTSGVFVDSNQTNITFEAALGSDVSLGVRVIGLPVASATLGPEFTTSLRLGLDGQQSKLYLGQLFHGPLDQSSSLPDLGTWLADNVHLQTEVKGDLVLTSPSIRLPEHSWEASRTMRLTWCGLLPKG
jgi:hypothetical protein